MAKRSLGVIIIGYFESLFATLFCVTILAGILLGAAFSNQTSVSIIPLVILLGIFVYLLLSTVLLLKMKKAGLWMTIVNFCFFSVFSVIFSISSTLGYYGRFVFRPFLFVLILSVIGLIISIVYLIKKRQLFT